MCLRKQDKLGSLSPGALIISLFLAVAVILVLGPRPASAQAGLWEASYYNSRDLKGQPVLVRTETAIDHDWKGLSPDPVVNVDDFSARWERTVQFSPGTYRFYATMDDGMRVWVNNQLIIDAWDEGKVRTREADVALSGGPQFLRVEYFEKGGVAIAGVTWNLVSSSPGQPSPPQGPPPSPPQGPPSSPPPGAPVPPPGPGQPKPQQPTGTVMPYFLNVRQGPGASFRSVAVIPRGTEVILRARSGGGAWVEVMIPQGVVGWVNKSYIHTTFPTQNLPVGNVGGPTQEPMATVNVASLNVRFGPGMNFGAFAVIYRDNKVAVLARDQEGVWVKVRIPSGAEGWVNSRYITGNYSMQHLPVAG